MFQAVDLRCERSFASSLAGHALDDERIVGSDRARFNQRQKIADRIRCFGWCRSCRCEGLVPGPGRIAAIEHGSQKLFEMVQREDPFLERVEHNLVELLATYGDEGAGVA